MCVYDRDPLTLALHLDPSARQDASLGSVGAQIVLTVVQRPDGTHLLTLGPQT